MRQSTAALPDIAARRSMIEQLAGAFEQSLERDEPVVASATLQPAGSRVYVEDGKVAQIALG